jgi:hypothetical protein
MAKQDTGELTGFLEAFEPEIRKIAFELRDFVWDLYPDSNELIYDGPAALAFGWTKSGRTGDVFCSIAIYNNAGVLFGFLKGAALSDPLGLLEGDGKQYRYIRVSDVLKFPMEYASKLLSESYDNALRDSKSIKDAPTGQTIVKSISEKKRRPPKSESLSS